MSTRRLLALTALFAILAVASCSGDGDARPAAQSPVNHTATITPTPTVRPIQGISSYVALGDSYTSGPAIATQKRAAGLCFRSDHNYASLIASDLAITSFNDVSCTGATTENLLHSASHPVSGTTAALAQVAAVKSSTSLVTVGIGGNDSGLFETLFRACVQTTNPSTDGCQAYVATKLPGTLVQTERAVASTLEAVVARASRARVLLVGYLRLSPTAKGCATFPVRPGDLPVVAGAESALDAALARAANDAKVSYVSMRAASAGHDACAGPAAWTNSASAPKDDGFPLHPNAAGMRAVAAAIEHELRSTS